MTTATIGAIDELINIFKNNKPAPTITIIKRVVKQETFSDDYHDFDMNELMNNKQLMQQLLLMEQEETNNNENNLITTNKSYLPSDSELQMIKSTFSEIKDIQINAQSSIISYETKFTIDRFEFAIQFMIFPKSFLHCWLGFVATLNKSNTMGGIGGNQMGASSMNNSKHIIKHHYLSNLMLSIPHRNPLKDEFGKTAMSSIALISSNNNDETNTKNIQQHMSGNSFLLSSNDLSLKLSKMLTRLSKCTVQISCDIPSHVINASILQRNIDGINDTNVVFEIEKIVMNIYKNIKQQKH